MTEILEKRVADIEALITDLPELLNIRFERVDHSLSEHTARFNLLDKQMAMLVRDMRDLRGGVTRQLLEQDRRLSSIDQKLEGQDRRLGTIEQKLEGQDRRLGTIEQKLEGQDKHRGAIESDVAAIRTDITEILSRLPKP
jgi:chromosome segregation ATPase